MAKPTRKPAIMVDDRRTSIANETPEHFNDEEFTTREAQEVAETARGDQQRTRKDARSTGRNVQRVAKIKRGHTGSAAAAVQAQQPMRENIPTEFKPVSDLTAPPAPRNMTLRWIRFKTGDRVDAKNLSKKFRMGWRPFLAKDAPENYLAPETSQTQYGEAISSGDLLLCYMPTELKVKRDAYFRRRLASRAQGVRDQVKNDLGEDLIVAENKTRTSRGRRPQFQES